MIVPSSVPDAALLTPATNFVSAGNYDFTPDAGDLNGNSIDDDVDIFLGVLTDANQNGIPDEFEVDCNNNGIPDDNELAADLALNGIPDECDINENGGIDGVGGSLDANENGIIDGTEVGDLIITEILGDPIGADATDGITESLVLQPGAVAVLINDYNDIGSRDGSSPLANVAGAFDDVTGDPLTDPIAEFRLGWGLDESVNIVAVGDWGARANNGSPGDEILSLYAPASGVITDTSINDIGIVVADVADYDADLTPLPTTPRAHRRLAGFRPDNARRGRLGRGDHF